MIEFEDVMFDSEPLELAEEFAALASEVEINILADEEAEVGEVIYFGLAAEIGEIIEVRGVVKNVEEVEEEVYRITVAVDEVDSEFQGLALQVMSTEAAEITEKDPIWALGLKQQNNTYAVLANTPGGIMTAAQLAKVAELAEKGAGVVKLTHAQRVVLLMQADQVEMAKEGLAEVGLKVGILHKGIRNIRACCGALCRFSQQTDGLGIAGELEEKLFGRYTAFNIKIAISDCMRNCSESYCADIGLIGDKGTYTVLVGGRGSMVPYRALILAKGIAPEQAVAAVEEIVDWYADNAQEGERLNKVLQRLGAEAEFDLGALEGMQDEYGDGVDELKRIREHFTRLAGLKVMQGAMSFCCSG